MSTATFNVKVKTETETTKEVQLPYYAKHKDINWFVMIADNDQQLRVSWSGWNSSCELVLSHIMVDHVFADDMVECTADEFNAAYSKVDSMLTALTLQLKGNAE